MVIAFEDIGAASPDAVAMTVAARTGWRKKNGGDLHIAVQLARLLAEVPKSRSAEHLMTSAQHHPSFAKASMLIGAGSLAGRLGGPGWWGFEFESPSSIGARLVPKAVQNESFVCRQARLAPLERCLNDAESGDDRSYRSVARFTFRKPMPANWAVFCRLHRPLVPKLPQKRPIRAKMYPASPWALPVQNYYFVISD
jgi:hypothetical protein